MSAASYARWRTRRDEQAARARRTRPSDRTAVASGHYQVAGWLNRSGWGAECACGTVFDGFDRHGEAVDLLERHITAPGGSKPHHAARAVDIRGCFGAGQLRAGRPSWPGQEAKTPPLDWRQCADRYRRQNELKQNGLARPLTDRQLRRLVKKKLRAMGPGAS